MSKAVYIVSAKRTAIGSFLGGLSSLSVVSLGAEVIKALIEETKVVPSEISEVILGHVLVGGLGQNPARQSAMSAGLPMEVPAYGVSHVCGSGLKAVALGMQAIQNGDSKVVIAGGQESMSNAMHAALVRTGVKMGNGTLVDMMQYDGLTDAFSNVPMGITAENIAKKFNIYRQMQDEFAYGSQQKAFAAQNSGKFNDEIVPITIKSRKGDVIFDKDEFIRPDTTLETLAKLRPAFDKEGTVTAGNASGINDGAACVMLVSEEILKTYNLKPLARLTSYAQAGVDPSIMGTGPIPAVKKALDKANWNIQDLDLIEANEAFAAQAISVNQGLGWDISKVNVNGGAIALGHPIGASGARVLVTLVHEMQKRKAKKGVATLCIGGGMGIAMCIEGC
ncbi:MAG: acetyl-CoA acetyltransferase [Rickettsiaceae bacterium]|jgi:acetyl-CoA C-acetyltransferase|nr:acetyl-CoA acetyltransferase [Rickettsiaceae bacterium]